MSTLRSGAVIACLTVLVSCSLPMDPKSEQPVVARFDPSAGVIPMPTDVVYDDKLGRLDLPIDEDMTAAEVAFRSFLNEGDGWSTTFPGKVEFSGPIKPATITSETFQIWHWGTIPARVPWVWDDATRTADYEGAVISLNDELTQLVVEPPRHGWVNGDKYAMVVRGGKQGVHDQQGRGVAVDAAFYYLRLREKLDTYENNRAFPGTTRDARMRKARDLEEVRQKLDPFFQFFESTKLPVEERIARKDIVALWSFSVTQQTELAMDRPSQRVPLPFDLLIDPDTQLIDLTDAPWDSELEAEAKKQANKLRGFGLSSNLMFELTRAVDPATATPHSIELYRTGDDPTQIPLESVKVLSEDGLCVQSPADEGCKYISLVIADEALPLEPSTTYAVVVHDRVRDTRGEKLRPMLIGHFMRTEQPLVIDGVNQLKSVPDDLAARLEGTRVKVDALLDHIGRDDVLTAWPFTTLDAVPEATEATTRAETVNLPFEPSNIKWQTLDLLNRDDAFESLFPGALAQIVRDVYALRLRGVGRVVQGTIASPYYLDRKNRRFRPDGSYEVEDVHFLMTIPESAKAGTPVPVVIFGHAVVTDRRFLLTVAGELAMKGFASVAIDFPFHGERIACVNSSLVAIPNFLSDELKDLTGFYDNLIRLPPCLSGDKATCGDTGQCLDENGNPEPFASFLTMDGKPAVMDMKPASGAAFLDVNDIPHIKDHFLQALIDLGSLKRALRRANWSKYAGVDLQTDHFYYAGQSLGAIIGAVYVAVDPDMHRSVLNVAGADMVDLFVDSTYFGPQISDYFLKEDLGEGTYKKERLLNVARWLIDSIDPQSVAHLYRTSGRRSLLQMDSGAPSGDIVIPNRTTRILQRVSGLPMREYPSILHADLVVPVLGDKMLEHMAQFLAGEINE